MLLSASIILLLAISGIAVTYLFEDDEPFLWRLCAGNVIGLAVFGTVGFILGSLFGLNTVTAGASLLLALSPATLFTTKKFGGMLRRDWARARGKLAGANLRKLLRFLYYTSFLLLFWIFFGQAMIETKDGIFTGDPHNTGDLPFHLGAIFGFADGNNFPPENPSFAGARFSYPFIADLATASFVKLGADVKNAMLVQNVSWAFSLLVIFGRFVFKLTNEKFAGRIAPLLLFFSGGLGFIWFFSDYWGQSGTLTQFLSNLPRDYTHNNDLKWGNSLLTLFMTQRSLLLGMPVTVLVLGHLWKIFTRPAEAKPDVRLLAPTFLVGVIAGLLPLIHLHSLAVLFVVTFCLLITKPDRWARWFTFGAGVAVVAVPELIWSMSGSASRVTEFIGWHFGWSAGDKNIVVFWLLNTGLVIPFLLLGAYLLFVRTKVDSDDVRKDEVPSSARSHDLLLFCIPFLFLFIVSNAVRLAPWEWDNIKVLIYWYVGSLPVIGFAVAWLWQQGRTVRLVAAVCVLVMTFAGALDVWRTASGQTRERIFDAEAVKIAEQIRQKTEPRALFLNAPTYNTAIVLTGRRSLMRFPGHLWSHGVDYGQREADVKTMYSGAPGADELIREYGIDYILVSPEERASVAPNEQYLKKFPLVTQTGQSRVYKTK